MPVNFKELRHRMYRHDVEVEGDTAVVKLTARELSDLLDLAAKAEAQTSGAWEVFVETLDAEISGGIYRTSFRVDNQFFTLAESSDGEEGLEHCRFIRQMFLKAMARLGLRPDPATSESSERPRDE